MIDYNKYHTGDPFKDNFLAEGKGIPHTLKWLLDDIFNDINFKEPNIININEYDLRLKNLNIIFKYHDRADIYAYSTFGIFTPIYEFGYFNNYLKDSNIIIYLNFDSYDKIDLKRVLLHELLHIYEIYQRIKNGTTKDLDWFVNNQLIKIRNKYKHDNFISDFIYHFYLSSKQEINARVCETYTILINDRNSNRDYLIDKLKKTESWRKINMLKNFNPRNYDINYDICLEFFTELNKLIIPKLKQDFTIYKMPINYKDINEILKKYKHYFIKRSKSFEEKLYKIIDEVITDVNKNK